MNVDVSGQSEAAGRSGQFVAQWDRGDVRRIRSSPFFIPRLCQVNITHLEFLRSIPEQPEFVILVVRMTSAVSSSRTLKCDKIAGESSSAFLTTPLDLSFSIQYAHNTRNKSNVLQIFVCRKKTRTRTLKTIASASIPMEDVVQCIVAKRLVLYTRELKNSKEPMCRVDVAISSVSMFDEFERQTRNVGDYREDLQLFSDEEWDEMDSRSNRRRRADAQQSASKDDIGGKSPNNVPIGADATTRRGFRSKISNLLRRRRTPMQGDLAGISSDQLPYDYDQQAKGSDELLDMSDDSEDEYGFDEGLGDNPFSDGNIDSEPEDSDSSLDEII